MSILFNRWLVSLLLSLPGWIPWACHVAFPPRPFDIPTGMIQLDMPYYIANAKGHFDKDGFHPFYGLHASLHYDTPRIYFQPHTLLIGVIHHATGWSGPAVFLWFGFFSGWVCMRLALAVFESLFGLTEASHWLGLIAWTWGGGILVLVGLPGYFISGKLDRLFDYDPSDGLWFLNLGRNLIYPTEAYFHALFLGSLLLVLNQRWLAALGLLGFLSMSHPFTGVEALLIFGSWAALEQMWVRKNAAPWTFLAGLAVLLSLHLAYYILFLNSFPEHAQLHEQWSLDWTYEAKHFVPAYLLVGGLAYWTLRSPALAGDYFQNANHRLFMVWFLVAFALANHEFAIKPAIQPLHFTRGYVWMPLFLMGCPSLLYLLSHLQTASAVKRSVVLGFLLLDNVFFLGTYHWRTEASSGEIYVDVDQVNVFDFLKTQQDQQPLLVSSHWLFNYIANSTTSIRTSHSQIYNTPQFETREKEAHEFLKAGKRPESWGRMPLLVVFDARDPLPTWLEKTTAREVHRNSGFRIFRMDPTN